jgi:carboxypeptidase Q
MQKLLVALAAASLLAAPAVAQPKDGASQTAEKVDAAALAKIKDEGLNRSKVMETAFYLTDVCGPRLAGSEGLARANAWTKKRLTDYGLANANVEALLPRPHRRTQGLDAQHRR